MTEELYYDSAYIKEFEAKVISCAESEKGGYEIILDRTAFFPEQGGQSSDFGTISFDVDKKTVVSYVSIDKDRAIRHFCDCEIPEGTMVTGHIDWEHRFSNMQQHTGEHIFSGIVSSRYGFDNVGFHLSDSEVTMDYNGNLCADDIADIEMAVNRAIWENVDVVCRFPSQEELASIEYRSKKELAGDVRIVTVEGYDVCACCAPHVLKTGEIGILKVVSCQKYKQGVRVSILCGKRALEYIRKEHNIISELTGILTTSSDKIADSVKSRIEENNSIKSELSKARDELIQYEVAAIDKAQKDVFVVKGADFDQNNMRKTVNTLAREHSGYCGIFAGSSSDGYRFIITTGSDNKDCNVLCAMLRSKYGAKGGGQPVMVQGSFQAANIEDVIGDCLSEIK